MNRIAIVGRPNVGKSALFNRIAGRRIAIVDMQSGITRDRITTAVEWSGEKFELIDTGGIIVNSKEALVEQIHFQAQVAMEEAQVILFTVDVTSGITALDQDVAAIIRKSDKPVLLVVNKCESDLNDPRLGEFYSLGFPDVFPVSAIHGLGINELLDSAIKNLPEDGGAASEESGIRVAVVGKPNVGKSTFINYLLKENRLVVDNAPGTTRDSVDVPYQDDKGNRFILVDTAGIKRSRRITEAVEKYSFLRSQDAIQRCDAAILMIDAAEGITTGDAKIARLVGEAGKSCVIAVNKWDLVTEYRQKEYAGHIANSLPVLSYSPVVFTRASEGVNIHKTLALTHRAYMEGGREVPTSSLNRIVQDALQAFQPPVVKGKRLKIYYATQVGSHPPRVLLFVNDRQLIKTPYINFIANRIRGKFPFTGNPLRVSATRRK